MRRREEDAVDVDERRIRGRGSEVGGLPGPRIQYFLPAKTGGKIGKIQAKDQITRYANLYYLDNFVSGSLTDFLWLPLDPYSLECT